MATEATGKEFEENEVEDEEIEPEVVTLRLTRLVPQTVEIEVSREQYESLLDRRYGAVTLREDAIEEVLREQNLCQCPQGCSNGWEYNSNVNQADPILLGYRVESDTGKDAGGVAETEGYFRDELEALAFDICLCL